MEDYQVVALMAASLKAGDLAFAGTPMQLNAGYVEDAWELLKEAQARVKTVLDTSLSELEKPSA